MAQWDCTHAARRCSCSRVTKASTTLDGDGHGTHVAGIIAGERGRSRSAALTFAGMAPRARSTASRCSTIEGEGEDGWIIKALDTVADLNEKAGSLVVHGVNLSLGGGFDPSVFGCGHTPLCQELRRLWRQGVLVVLAAGNEGYAVLKSEDGDIQSQHGPLDRRSRQSRGGYRRRLGAQDQPAHLRHLVFLFARPDRRRPQKPDVVAPGEKILSARHDWKSRHSADTGRRSLRRA